MSGHMLQPQLEERFLLEIYQNATGNDFLQNVTCFGCGEKGHFKDKCLKAGNQQNDGARGRAYVSFVSSAFTPFIDIAPTALNTSYEVELAGCEKAQAKKNSISQSSLEISARS
ncbi:putative reverse transcriptase domain-containing protein [Tanacetum coccineum]